MDISKLKVPELRKELKARGLPMSGNKTELMERLQGAIKNKIDDTLSAESVDDLDEDLLEEEEEEDDEHLDVADSVLNDLDSPVENKVTSSPLAKPQKRKSSISEDSVPKVPKKIVLNRDAVSTEEKSETESIENKSPEEEKDDKADDKKVIKLSELSAKERLEMRAKKFGVAISGDAMKVARAERFGAAGTGTEKSSSISAAAPPTVDVLKQRAQRFGVSVSTALTKLENQERMDKRKERFGGAANGTTTTTTTTTAAATTDKAQARLERFKQPVK